MESSIPRRRSPRASRLQPFYIQRHEDVHGNTGTGIVAEGVIFSCGKGVMRWLDEVATTVFFDKIEDIEAIHGHGGKTVVVFE